MAVLEDLVECFWLFRVCRCVRWECVGRGVHGMGTMVRRWRNELKGAETGVKNLY